MIAIFTLVLFSTLLSICWSSITPTRPWSRDEATKKWVQNSWVVGCNFVTSTSQNELTMFQAETYDAATTDLELGYAQSLGFNGVRVFLHNLLYSQGPDKFMNTLDNFLNISSSHGIGVMFVLFDSCWNGYPTTGIQPDPIPYVHNSRWVQAPGYDIVHNSTQFLDLKDYVVNTVSRFRDDPRVIAWDVWNEPDNSGYTSDLITPLITQVFSWAREANPSQPLTSPLWTNAPWDKSRKLSDLEKVQLSQSDVISFHNYSPLDTLSSTIDSLKGYEKPIVCTEYMAREAGSYFNPNLGYMQEQGVSAFNWGLVSGLSQTIYPWDSWDVPNPYTSEPDVWFHDILHPDGSAKFQDEVDYIRSVTTSTKPLRKV